MSSLSKMKFANILHFLSTGTVEKEWNKKYEERETMDEQFDKQNKEKIDGYVIRWLSII